MVEISRLTLCTWVSFQVIFGQLLNRRLNATSCPLPFQVISNEILLGLSYDLIQITITVANQKRNNA